MTALQDFEAHLTTAERKVWHGLSTPAKIQTCLDDVPYSGEERYRCPLTFIRGYTRPLNLSAYDRVLTPAQIRALPPMDKRSFEAGMLGLNVDGVYKP